MNSKIISEKAYPLLKRKELVLQINHQKAPTPKTEEITKSIAEATKNKEDLISVRLITNQFGSNTAEVTAYVYENEEAKNAMERINKKKLLEAERKAKQEAKEKPEKATPAEEKKEAPTAEKPAEKAAAPVEEKKEEESK